MAIVNIPDELTEVSYAVSHGANGFYLGLGGIYYGLVQMLHANLAVCIGSGGGFVPGLMRQAQRDARINGAVVLIDANQEGHPGNGLPDYADPGCWFRQAYPEIDIRWMRSDEASTDFADGSIDYLHIDGDHTYEGAKADFDHYWPKIRTGGVVTLHDTSNQTEVEGQVVCGVDHLIYELENFGFQLLNFPGVHHGLAILRKP